MNDPLATPSHVGPIPPAVTASARPRQVFVVGADGHPTGPNGLPQGPDTDGQRWSEHGLPAWFGPFLAGAGHAARESGQPITNRHPHTTADGTRESLHYRLVPLGRGSDALVLAVVSHLADTADAPDPEPPIAALVRLPDWRVVDAEAALSQLLAGPEHDLPPDGLLTAFERPDDPVRLAEHGGQGDGVENMATRLVDSRGDAVPVRISAVPASRTRTHLVLLIEPERPDSPAAETVTDGHEPHGRTALQRHLSRALARCPADAFAAVVCVDATGVESAEHRVRQRLDPLLPNATPIVRLGAGRFGAVIEGLRDSRDGERIRRYLTSQLPAGASACRVGIALAPPGDPAPDGIITRAEAAASGRAPGAPDLPRKDRH